ncbi:hypothetical protein ABZ356_03650 [Micromonospora zamorensis]|uniref:hypothetical protein n=1 Tax=Micromonospora zamorensis TaxID=709883 RepID=UPI0033C145D3
MRRPGGHRSPGCSLGLRHPDGGRTHPGRTQAPAQPAAPPSRAFTPPLSRTLPPSIGTPPKPPKPTPPTDLRDSGLIAGHITRGGSGPCYGLLAEDGRAYALHGQGAGNLAEGSFVTLRIASRSSDIDCGPGIRVSIVAP